MCPERKAHQEAIQDFRDMRSETKSAENTEKKFRNGGFTKWEFARIIIAVTILMAVSLSYYFYVRYDTLQRAQRRAEFTLKYADKLIRTRLDKVETIVGAMRLRAEYLLDDPDKMFVVSQHAVESSPQIVSAAVGFKEFYYPEKGRWFEPAASRLGSDSSLVDQVGSETHDYTKMEWFLDGLESEQGDWSDPYVSLFDNGSYLITYSLPVHDKNDQVVGVVCADVSIDTIADFVSDINLYPHSYYTLVTESGVSIIPPPDKRLRGKYHTFSEPIDNKNIILTLYIPDSDMYSRLRRSGLVFAVLALLGMLAAFFIAYRYFKNLKGFNEMLIKDQFIEEELAIARKIQESLLPTGRLPGSVFGVNIQGLQIPAKYVGGDLFDYYVRDNKLFFCIGDVSGKGIPAALLMAIAHSLFRSLSAHNTQPERIASELNVAMSDNNPDLMFITFFLGVMDLTTGVVRYCNAGHNPPIVIRHGHAEFLDTEPSLLLGVELDATYTAYEVALDPGDALFLYTDGLTEAENPEKKLFGEKRVLNVASRFGEKDPLEQIQTMHETVVRFSDGAEQSDDLTMLAIRFVTNKQTLTLTNDVDELSRLEPFLSSALEEKKVDPSIVSQVNLSVEEAVANVIMYAYPEGTTGTVDIVIDVSDDVIRLEISDSGVPFNPLEHEEINLDVPLDERPIGGLGIHLVKEIMDMVKYRHCDGRNILTLEKRY